MAAPHSTNSHELSARKTGLRAWARGVRAGLDAAAAGAAVARRVMADPPGAGVAVAGFWPIGDEIDLRVLWYQLHARGCVVVLPQTTASGSALVFRAWAPGAAMVGGRFGTQWPDGPVAVPGLVFVPFLAFDGAGHRLGYGGGYYDRTLAALPGVRAVGLGFSALAVDSVPVGPHDRALDAVMTEAGMTVPAII